MMQTWRIKNRTKKKRPTTQLKGSAIHQFEAMRLTGMRVVHANVSEGGEKAFASPPPHPPLPRAADQFLPAVDPLASPEPGRGSRLQRRLLVLQQPLLSAQVVQSAYYR